MKFNVVISCSDSELVPNPGKNTCVVLWWSELSRSQDSASANRVRNKFHSNFANFTDTFPVPFSARAVRPCVPRRALRREKGENQ